MRQLQTFIAMKRASWLLVADYCLLEIGKLFNSHS